MLGRFAGIDRTSEDLFGEAIHVGTPLGRSVRLRRGAARRPACRDLTAGLSGPLPSSLQLPGLRNPKNRGPPQAVPVMARAMVERLLKVVPRQTNPSGTTVTVCR